jgi:outer membrane murein-binding lipoprotein Lpp
MLFIVSISFIFLASCSRIDTIESKINTIENKVSELKSEIEMLKLENQLDKIDTKFDESAYLTPDSEGYLPIKTDIGFITVSLKDIKSYANGSKILLRLGNPISATIFNLKMKIEWGLVDKKGEPDNANTKSRDVEVSQELLGGAWTNVNIVLAGISPNDLGFVRIKNVSVGGIKLRY